ncbi:hypothetical protein MLD38_019086 [Melastoma candidum]|uniref:Uncharacterized protein n=1 Tax=Melastoma candidum TaxID=119954 RepID=A0ACB9QYY7_9MYRT|nr:hypothetical protein MLD38_019086 [Melastoma candidum]
MGTLSCITPHVQVCYHTGYRDCMIKERKFVVELNQKFQRCRLPRIFCSVNTAAGHPDNSKKINFQPLINKATDIWNNMPQAVKIFPLDTTFWNFIQLTIDLILAVVKLLSVPLLVVSSLSEMSYCAHQRKLLLVPFPFLLGVAVAWVFKETLLELSPLLKEGRTEVPWHVIAIAIVFTLVKLPGPYYPYWGRMLLPHMANGALLSSLWFAYQWLKKSPEASK